MAKFLLTFAWVAASIAFMAFVAEPVSVKAQFAFAFGGCAAMIAIKWLGLRGPWRHVFLAIGTSIVLRYYYWRTTNTLPPFAEPLNFTAGVLLWAAEAYSGVMLAISLFVTADPIERPPPPIVADADLPTVDVYVPTYNEDPAMVAMTVAGALRMDYPAGKLKVFILDDGGTDQKCGQANEKAAAEARARRAELTQLAADLGAGYLTRAKNLHAKAGNMNSALAHTKGAIILVFDADHVPMREFLRHTAGHFVADPKLFLCQTPHCFSNPDPLEKNLGTFKSMPSENEMFYGIIQRGLDKWNAAFFCGSAALVRRKALEEVGGFSGISITEDCETALDLHARGWNSLYVDRPMISGLQPETFASFIGQRSRWARGMFQIFLLKNPLMKRGLSWAQRICYLSNMTFWFFPIFRLPFLVAPLLYIWFSMQIYVANTQEFIAYTALYMVANMLMQNYQFGKVRWTWVSELYEFVQSVYLSRGLLSVVLNPRKPTFNVTDKGQSLETDHLSELATPYFAIYAVLAASAVMVFWRWFTEPDANELLLVVGVWNAFNLLLAGAALGVVSERRTPRVDVDRKAEVALGPAIAECRIADVSYGGCRVLLPAGPQAQGLERGAQGVLRIVGRDGAVLPSVPVKVSNFRPEGGDLSVGFEFETMKLEQRLAVMDVMYEDMSALARWREGRQKQRGVWA
ncbi:MAG: UDP-forming cellulose synthase catalytic subunit, partial [Hyphomicrobiales bacterium]|nr:UDP-forming cellulose synthase catalytic subunit [Hyphomicrobiales bacterium]